MTDLILKNRFIVILSFFLYTVFFVYYFNTVGFTLFGPKSQAAFEDVNACSLLICFLLMFLLAIVRKKKAKTRDTRSDISIPFIFKTIISGFFFAAGSFFFLKGMTVDEIKNATETYHPVLFSWSQICILALVALSVIVLYLFFRFDKKALFSFIGYILTLTGLLLLYYGGYRFTDDSFLQFSVLFFAGSQSAAPMTNAIIAGIFWIISTAVNRTVLPKYQRDIVWLETLFFSFLISTIGVVYLSLLYNRNVLFYSDFHYESICFYAFFLFLCLQGYLLASEQKDWLSIEDKVLKRWLSVILFLNFALCLFIHKDFPFMIKTTSLCLGIYFIWTPTVNFKTEMRNNRFLKNAILLFLGYVLTGCFVLVVFQIFLYGIWLQDTVLWNYIVLFQEHKYVSVFLLSAVVTALFGKRYSFEKATNCICRGIILCIMAWLTTGIVQETIISLLTAVIAMGKLGWWDSASKETQGMWLGISLVISSVISLIFSFWQCKKGIGRIIIWTLISNVLLYKGFGFSIGIGLQQLLMLKNIPAIAGINETVIAAFSLMIMPYLIMIALLGLSFILVFFTNVERSLLPNLANCRMPNSAEKEKLEKVSATIFAKTGIPDSAYRFLVCQSHRDNPFSIGRNTVAVPQSLLAHYPDHCIVGFIAHEIGHIKQRDGHYQFIIDALNLPIYVISKIISSLLTGQKKIILLTFPVIFILVFSGLSGAVIFGMSRIIFYFLLQTAILMNTETGFQRKRICSGFICQ